MIVSSSMHGLGTPAPDFALHDAVSGEIFRRSEWLGMPLVVMFLSNHCPQVQHLLDGLTHFGQDFENRALGLCAINSNDLGSHPEDGPVHMKALGLQRGWSFPFLYDPTQTVARAFGATCTPDFYVYDADHHLVYRGRFDDSTPGNGYPVTGADLRRALEALLSGLPVHGVQHPSEGCSIKWKP